jgi:tRNA uridine 5-carboxymethylaminomethyl modification enzyme
VQLHFYRSIPGLEKLEIVRPAYAIEYDCIDPVDLKLSLEHRDFPGLFCAGQFNGSSGYEEAAAQGLMAGINAALWLDGREAFILDRSEAYIGVLIDDLVTKGTEEPYRIMTSRVEYRLLLRQDNADLRLTEKGRALGLVSDARWEKYLDTKQKMEAELLRLAETVPPAAETLAFLESQGLDPGRAAPSLAALLKRPQLDYENLAPLDPLRPALPRHLIDKVQVAVKYEGYINKQREQVARFQRMEQRQLPERIDYEEISGLRLEARQKLNRYRPRSLGQASRISGVSPADINVLLVYLEKLRRQEAQ